jgi:hypothetical protein
MKTVFLLINKVLSLMFMLLLSAEQRLLIRTITEHCLPKLVCELFSRQMSNELTEHEVGLMNLIG